MKIKYLRIGMTVMFFPIILARVFYSLQLRIENRRAKREAEAQRVSIETMAQDILQRPGMKVRLIRQHGLKAWGFFERWGGSVFQVIQKRDGGYDVDLEPLGYPGKWGWMYEGEVEEIA